MNSPFALNLSYRPLSKSDCFPFISASAIMVPESLSPSSIGIASAKLVRSIFPLNEASMFGSDTGVLTKARTSNGLAANWNLNSFKSITVLSVSPPGFVTFRSMLIPSTLFGKSGYLNWPFPTFTLAVNPGIVFSLYVPFTIPLSSNDPLA